MGTKAPDQILDYKQKLANEHLACKHQISHICFSLEACCTLKKQ